jgi:hypothetical protein
VVSPKELFTGRRTDFKTDLRVSFGEYVEVDTKSPNNTMLERTNSAIALLPTGNINSSIKFFLFQNQSIVTRERWTTIEIPDMAVRALNTITLEESSEPSREVTFEQGAKRAEVLDEEPPPLPPQVNNDRDILLPEMPIIIPEPDQQAAPEQEETVAPETKEAIQDVTENIEDGNEPPEIEEQSQPWSERLRANRKPNPKYFANHMSVKKATQLHGHQATDAIKNEIREMLSKEVWTPVHKTKQMRTIPSLIFLNEKFRDDGSLEKIKAHLVAGGNRQDTPIASTAAPTVSAESNRLARAHAAKGNKRIAIADVTGAFLNAKMNEDVHMDIRGELASNLLEQNPAYHEYARGDGAITVRLKKALSGLKQSAYLWYEEIKSTLMNSCNLKVSVIDRCVFFNEHTVNHKNSGTTRKMLTSLDPRVVGGNGVSDRCLLI